MLYYNQIHSLQKQIMWTRRTTSCTVMFVFITTLIKVSVFSSSDNLLSTETKSFVDSNQKFNIIAGLLDRTVFNKPPSFRQAKFKAHYTSWGNALWKIIGNVHKQIAQRIIYYLILPIHRYYQKEFVCSNNIFMWDFY